MQYVKRPKKILSMLADRISNYDETSPTAQKDTFFFSPLNNTAAYFVLDTLPNT